MGLFVSKSDFKGKYAVATTAYENIDAHILKYEQKYLIELMGAKLYALFKADLDTNNFPTADIYKSIFNPINEDFNHCLKQSDGIKEMLLGFIYFEYLRDVKFKPTANGIVVSSSENSREAGFDEANIYNRYNDSIKSYCCIQWYITEHIEDYTLFNGQKKGYAYWI